MPSLYATVLQQLTYLISPLAAANSPDSQKLLFQTIGWDLEQIPGFSRVKLTQVLNTFAELKTRIETLSTTSEATLEELLTIAQDSRNLLRSLQDDLQGIIEPPSLPPPQFEQIGRDLIALLFTTYLRQWQPQLYAVAVIAELITFTDAQAESSVVVENRLLLRLPHSRPQVNLQRLGQFFRNPFAEVARVYHCIPSELGSETQTTAIRDRLLPRLAAIAEELNIGALPGIAEDDKSIFAGAVDNFGLKLGEDLITFIIAVNEQNQAIGATVAVSPPTPGNLGVVIAPFGPNANAELLLKQWLIRWQWTDTVTAFAIGFPGLDSSGQIIPGTPTWVTDSSPLPPEASATLQFIKLPNEEGCALLIGNPSETRLEVQQFQVTANFLLKGAPSAGEAPQTYRLIVDAGATSLVLGQFFALSWEQAEFNFSAGTSTFVVEGLRIASPALLESAIAGKLQLQFQQGNLDSNPESSYFDRNAPNADLRERIGINKAYLDHQCLVVAWQEEQVNYWLNRLVPNFLEKGNRSVSNALLRILFDWFSPNPIQKIRLDWEIAGSDRRFDLPGFSIQLPGTGQFSLLLGAGQAGEAQNSSRLNSANLVLTLEPGQVIKLQSNFAWQRPTGNVVERELQSDRPQEGPQTDQPLFSIELTTDRKTSICLASFTINQDILNPKLPTFLRDLKTPLSTLSTALEAAINPQDSNQKQEAIAVLRSRTNFNLSEFINQNNWRTLKLRLGQLTLPFLNQQGDVKQFIRLDSLKEVEVQLSKSTTNDEIPLEEIPIQFDALVQFGEIALKTSFTAKLNLRTLALSINHDEGIRLYGDIDELAKPQLPHLGLSWSFQGRNKHPDAATDPDLAKKVYIFTLVTQNYNYQLQQAPNTEFTLEYTAISKEPIRFKIRDFILSDKGISLSAEVTDDPVTLNSLDTRFRFRNTRLEIKENQISDFTLNGSGPLPPALVGEAIADISLQFKQVDRKKLALVTGSAELQMNKPLICQGTRFQFSVNALGLKFVDDGHYHLYFTLTGSAQFVPLPSDDSNGPLALLQLIRIDLVECPITGNARVLSQYVQFLINLPSPKTFSFLGCFEMEVKAIGFLPQAAVFGDDGAMMITGQLRFAQGVGDTPNPKPDYHTLLIGLPKPSDFKPRIHFKQLAVSLDFGAAFKLTGVVNFYDDDPNKTGFDGEGTLAIQGLPPIAASFAFLRVRRDEMSQWLRAWFIYIELRQVSFRVPVVELYLREIGLGFGYRFTLVSIKAADRENDLRRLIGELRKLSRTQGNLANRDQWAIDLEEPGQDPRWTIALRALIAQSSASVSPLEYDKVKEENLPCAYLFDAVIAFRSDLTFFMAVRGWLNTNYDSFVKNRDNLKEKPLFSGFALLSPRQKRFLAQVSSNPNGYLGDRPRLPDFIQKAVRNSQFAATLLVEPGLIHYELGWPNMLRWSDRLGPLLMEVRGGFIFRISRQNLVIGSSILARGQLRLDAEANLGFVGARVSAEVSVAFGARYIGVLRNYAQPKKLETAFYAAVGLEARIELSIEFWIRINLLFKKITKSFRLSTTIGFTAGVEFGLNNLEPGLSGSGTLAVSAMGHSLQLSVRFGLNEGALREAKEKTSEFLQMGLEATDVEGIPGVDRPRASVMSAGTTRRSVPAGPSSRAVGMSLTGTPSTVTTPVTSTSDSTASPTNPTEDEMSLTGIPSTVTTPATLTSNGSTTSPTNLIEDDTTDTTVVANDTSESVKPKFHAPDYITFVLETQAEQKEGGFVYFLLLPQGESSNQEFAHEQGFLPAPPKESSSEDFDLTLLEAISGLEKFQPSQAQVATEVGTWQSVSTNQITWRGNWASIVISNSEGESDEKETVEHQIAENGTLSKESVAGDDISLKEYLAYAFIFKQFGDSTQSLEALGDPELLPSSKSIEDPRVFSPSDNAYEAAVRGAIAQFQGSPYFKRDQQNSEYDRLLDRSLDSNTTIYSETGQVTSVNQTNGQSTPEAQKNQQALQLRGTIIQDMVADLRDYVAAVEQPDGSRDEGQGTEIIQRSVAFQMGLVFRVPKQNAPDWLLKLTDDSMTPTIHQRLGDQSLQDSEKRNVRTFNPSITRFSETPPRFERVHQLVDTNTIALGWNLSWDDTRVSTTSSANGQSLTQCQADPRHHLQHYEVRRTALNGFSNDNQDEIYTVTPCDLLHRESNQLIHLQPRFQVVDHFNQESAEEQAAIPPEGISYRYVITPVDFSGHRSNKPLVLFATRYPNTPPLVPTDGELVITYDAEELNISNKIPVWGDPGSGLSAKDLLAVWQPARCRIEWSDPPLPQRGPKVPINQYRLIFRRENTLPIGTYGLDNKTQGSRQTLLPTSNARQLSTDIVVEIDRTSIESIIITNDAGQDKEGKGTDIKLDDLKDENILPRADLSWRPEAWRVFLQTESWNGVSSALAPVRLRLQFEKPKTDKEKRFLEERRPAALEWILNHRFVFPVLPPKDHRDEKGDPTDDGTIPFPGDTTRIARFPMPLPERSLKFEPELSNIGYSPHPSGTRCLRHRWNIAPSSQPNYPLDLHAGYQLFRLDVDAHPDSVFDDVDQLPKAIRLTQDVQLIPNDELLLEPGDTLNPGQWEAWYPSTMRRLRNQERRQGANLALGAWSSWRESYLVWPTWLQWQEGQFVKTTERSDRLHGVLQRLIEIFSKNEQGSEEYIVDVQAVPPLQPCNFAAFTRSTASASDPYGWGILQQFGLSVTFSLRKADGKVLAGDELLPRITEALLQLRKEAENTPAAEIAEHLHIELLFQPGRSVELQSTGANPTALLAIVQLSLRPYPKQRLQYSTIMIRGFAGSQIDVEIELAGRWSLINQADSANGQQESSADKTKVDFKVTLPPSGVANLLLRSEILSGPKELPKFRIIKFTYDQSEKANEALTNLATEPDLNLSNLPSESVMTHKILVTDARTAYFATSPDNLANAFSQPPVPDTEGLSDTSQQWQRFKNYIESLNSNDPDLDPKQFKIAIPTDEAGLKQFLQEDFLGWSQRFFDFCGDINQTEVTTLDKPWVATAYPKTGSPTYAAPDDGGRITYDELIEDRYAHAYRYFAHPYGRYDLLLDSLRQSFALFSEALFPERSLPIPKVGGLDIVLHRTEPISMPLVLSSRRLDPVVPEGQSVVPGTTWEVIIARHLEQSLSERNQTLVRHLSFRQIAFTLLRRFSDRELSDDLEEVFGKRPVIQPVQTYPEREIAIPQEYPARPVEVRSTQEERLSLDLPARIGDFQQGAVVLQWQGLPFYYEHRLLLIAQSSTTVSAINKITQRDFEYQAPSPIGASLSAIDNDSLSNLRTRQVKLPLQRLWDSLPPAAKGRWAVEDPANASGEGRYYSSLPDLDVVYQFVELFSGNVEVQGEVFCDRKTQSSASDKSDFQHRQLGQRLLLNITAKQAPTTPPEDYYLTITLEQVTEQSLKCTYDLNQLSNADAALKQKLLNSTLSTLKIKNDLTINEVEKIVGIANGTAQEQEQDRKALQAIAADWMSEAPISITLPDSALSGLPDHLKQRVQTIDAPNSILVWEGGMTEVVRQQIKARAGSALLQNALKMLSDITPPPRPTQQDLPDALRERLEISLQALRWHGATPNNVEKLALRNLKVESQALDAKFKAAIDALIERAGDNRDTAAVTEVLLPIIQPTQLSVTGLLETAAADLPDELLIANALIRFQGLMTLTDLASLQTLYPDKRDRLALRRLYTTALNRGLNGRALYLRTRRGSAAPSPLIPLEPLLMPLP
ncbi:hypothetical protein [Phormidium tenue]|nr:hypothetical protein [Phormidium tenue]